MANPKSEMTKKNERLLIEEVLETGTPQQPLAGELQHWRCHIDPIDVQWWGLDQADTNTNKISQDVLAELRQLLYQFNENKIGCENTQAVVIRSLKASGFAAGADISEFSKLNDPESVEELLSEGRDVLAALEKLSVPSISLIHGYCMGAGLEIALACQYRIARNDATFAFPEINLGLHPGLGGTVRLTRQIDPTEALTMMLTGKPMHAKKARKLGLVDDLGKEHHFYAAIKKITAKQLAKRGQSAKTKLLNKKPSIKVIAQQTEKQTSKKVDPEHYPAPFALIDLYRTQGHSAAAMYREEGKSFADLLSSETSRQLVRVFFMREQLKAQSDNAINTVHVVGAGSMGGDIAAWCALRGMQVTLEDKHAQFIAPAVKRANKLFSDKCKTTVDVQQCRDRFLPDPKGYGRAKAGLLIEAIPEKIELKAKLLRELEVDKNPDAIIATNTSSLLLQRLRENLQDGSALVGIHFFNPVAKMPLVEVVKHDQLGSKVRDQAQAFVSAIGRLPVVVKSSPGFLVNRVLTPYLLEALALLDEEVAKETIDAAAEQFGMPMGPIELADFIGLDICLHVANTLSDELEQAFYRIQPWFKQLVADNKLGKKTSRGLYQYDKNNKPKKGKVKTIEQDEQATLRDRLILPLINTCVHCLDEEIVEDPELLDAAIIFATGFPPHTGGPLSYAVNRGPQDIVERLKGFTDSLSSPRFSPATGWNGLATTYQPRKTTKKPEYISAA